MAFLKRSRRFKNGCVYESWAIVESVRTAKRPRQRTIATLGKAPEYEAEERLGWEDVVDQLSGRGSRRLGGLFESPAEPPAWAQVDLRKVRVERLRRGRSMRTGCTGGSMRSCPAAGFCSLT